MSRVISLAEALHDRMALVAQAMAERVGEPGAWEGYRATERLVGHFTKPSSLGGAPTVSYHREGNPRATVTLGFLEMTNIKERDKGMIVVIDDNIVERKRYDVSLKSAIKTTRTITHTFERTESFSEAYSESVKKAWEAGGKASLSAEYAGIKGAVEVFGKYGEEATSGRSSERSKSETTRDTISETFEFQGPIEFTVEAFRSRQREQRVVRAQADFDGKVYWSTGFSAWEFTTFFTQFMPVARRTADDGIYGYKEFMDKPLSDEEIDALARPSDKIVEFVVEYDNILTESLKEV